MRHRFFLVLVAMLFCRICMADNDCVTPLAIRVDSGMPTNNQAILEKKLREEVTRNGMNGNVKNALFVMFATTEEQNREVTSGLRPVVTLTMDIHLFIKNSYTGDVFSATSFSLNGSGRNETSAKRAAIQNVTSQGRHIQLFLQEAKRKIDEYYDSHTKTIIAQAEGMAAKKEFEKAMFLLSSVPVCSKKYDKVEEAMLKIFQQYINQDCNEKLAKARGVWNASQNNEGALLAGAYLAAIDPDSDCAGDAKKLSDAIKKKIGEQWDFYKEQQRDSMKLEELRIKAIRTIGNAHAEEDVPTPEPEQDDDSKKQKLTQENSEEE